MTDLNVDITTQDGLRLSELYGQLGQLQHNLANFDIIATNERLCVAAMVAVIGVLIGFLLVLWLYDEYSDTKQEYIMWIGIVLYIALLITIWYFASEWSVICKENALQRDITSVQMQIDAIKMKYGWV